MFVSFLESFKIIFNRLIDMTMTATLIKNPKVVMFTERLGKFIFYYSVNINIGVIIRKKNNV